MEEVMKFDLAKALQSDNVNWEALAREQKATADRQRELLREILDEVFPDDEYWPELFSRDLIDRLAKELADD